MPKDENYTANPNTQFSRGGHNNHAFILPSSTFDSDVTETPSFTPVMLTGFVEVARLSEVNFDLKMLKSAYDVQQRGHGIGPRSNTLTFDEDIPLFTLSLINSAIDLGGPLYVNTLSLIQDELFRNLMQFGLSMSSLLLSMVCSIVLNLYHHLRMELKLQLEVFISCVVLRLAQSRHGASYKQQEVAMEALVDFCRQKTFMVEMYANLD
ncbi:hypothetical protein GIB67_028396 [Kingdonia uniflora]|uniref:Mon2/Sec7/BIG1-like HUS domain-containing protein n=1 Tax=Kingdonia uniflora TaxID=39325 RepID=A0A7J7MIA3_9MAGN|nr:hypothetical protein GIB67_028396 [Kingdonia uniflora]